MKDILNHIVYWNRKENAKSHPERLINHHLKKLFPEFSNYSSSKQFFKSPLYQKHKNEIDQCLCGAEYGFNSLETDSYKKFYRAIFFNLSGEIQYRTLYDVLKYHPILSKGDFYFFTNTDIGMKRTENRNLVRSLALEFSYDYVFAPSYFYLDQETEDATKMNQLGVVGNAIMSRFPIEEFQILPIGFVLDPMKRRHKRLGLQRALLVRVQGHKTPIDLLSVNLDGASSPRQRTRQLKHVLHHYNRDTHKEPLLMAGEWNTSTFNCKSPFSLLLSFLNKAMRGYQFIKEEHLTYPDRFFEKNLFSYLAAKGFHFHDLNQLGKATIHCQLNDLDYQDHLNHGLLNALMKFSKQMTRDELDNLSLKLDWFASTSHIRTSQDPQAERPKVLSNLYSGGSVFTKHHPLILDFEVFKGTS